MGPGAFGLACRRDGNVRPGRGLRHLRLLHRNHRRRVGGFPWGLHRFRGRQPDHPGRFRRQERRGLPGLFLLRGERREAECGRNRRGSRLYRSHRRSDQQRDLRAPVPPAVHLRAGRRGPDAAHSGVHSLLPEQGRPGAGSRSRLHTLPPARI